MPYPRRAMLTRLLPGTALAATLLALPGTATAGSVPAAAASDGAILFGVSCTGPARCMAVGSRPGTKTLAERWAGGRWRVLPTPNPAGPRSSFLIEVSCRSAASCVAVGDTVSGTHGPAALAEAWNGSAWRLITPPKPAGARSSEFLDVSCRGSSGCMAVGLYRTRGRRLHPLTELWNGTRWRVLATPGRPRARGAFLDGVFCAGSRCKAVGSSQPSASRVVGLAEAWNGTRWRVVTFPSPAMASFVGVQAVSCGSSTDCVAVGQVAAPVTRSLAERWHAGKWRLVSPAPRSPAEALLNGVSCTSASRCVAVGQSGAGSVLLAEAWNGTRWRVLKTPHPPPSTSSFLNQVSCTSARHCVAVGSRGTSRNASALAEIWNGRTWRVSPVPAAHGKLGT